MHAQCFERVSRLSFSVKAGQAPQHGLPHDVETLGHIGEHSHPGKDYQVGELTCRLTALIVTNYAHQLFCAATFGNMIHVIDAEQVRKVRNVPRRAHSRELLPPA